MSNKKKEKTIDTETKRFIKKVRRKYRKFAETLLLGLGKGNWLMLADEDDC